VYSLLCAQCAAHRGLRVTEGCTRESCRGQVLRVQSENSSPGYCGPAVEKFTRREDGHRNKTPWPDSYPGQIIRRIMGNAPSGSNGIGR
jgi:hypothetical protein